MPGAQTLNERAATLCQALCRRAADLRAEIHTIGGGTVVDLGVAARGGLEAGVALAEVCLAGLGRVQIVPGDPTIWHGPTVSVSTDHPLAACLGSQYAGWRIAVGDYFAMGSGPMRAAAGKEELFRRLGIQESAEEVVGVLETSKLPSTEAMEYLAGECGVPRERVTLAVARTASQAGAVQIVARSVETALHKLHELKFDVGRVESGWGLAPLPPPAANDLAGIGRTNDSLLYGARVTLWVRGDDASLQEIGPHVPSSASSDYGQPFAEIFEQVGHDFYKIDPLLFSPAMVTLSNLDSGNSFAFGRVSPEVIRRSFMSG